MIVTNVTVPLLGMVDTAVVGHLEEPSYLGAVAVGATIFSFLFMGLNFLRMGTTGLAAQALGSGDFSKVRNVLGQAVAIALALAAILIVLQKPIGQLAFYLLEPSPEVVRHGWTYFSIRIWSGPATLVNYAIIGWFIGMQNTRAPLIIMLTINVINILLDVVLVSVMGFAAGGVAAASVTAELAGVATGALLVRHTLSDSPGHWQPSALRDLASLRRLFEVNANIFVRTLALMFSFGFITAVSARQGTVLLAANAVLLNFQTFMAYALDGFANAAEALVGKTIGARNREDFDRTVTLTLKMSLAVAVFFSLAWWLGGPLLIGVLTGIEEVRAAAINYLPWIIALPVISVWSFTYDGIYVGATLSREMRNMMLLSTFGVFVPVWFVFSFLGNHGLWLAFTCFMAARGLTMFVLLEMLRRQPGRLLP